MKGDATSSPFVLERGQSLLRDAWARLRKNRLALVCLFLFSAIVLICIFGPMCSPYEESTQDLKLKASPPSAKHWFGTDHLGRDLATRVMTGGRISLAVGLAATAVSLIIGVLYGAVAGYFGGRTDAILMRTVDALYAVPFLILVVLVKVTFDQHFSSANHKLIMLFLVIGAVEWLTMSRIVRGQVLGLKRMEFVEAARSLGATDTTIIVRHLIPNTLGPVIVYATLTVPAVMLVEATLSFLGLGVEAPKSSWGSMINEGAQRMETAPWMLFFPALFFSTTLFSLNFLGDGLRDALDVKSAKD